jgi:hypothetical protein
MRELGDENETCKIPDEKRVPLTFWLLRHLSRFSTFHLPEVAEQRSAPNAHRATHVPRGLVGKEIQNSRRFQQEVPGAVTGKCAVRRTLPGNWRSFIC